MYTKYVKKIYWEVVGSIALVLVPTYIVYKSLEGVGFFWNANTLWSVGLIICWLIVASGYYHQGWLVREHGSRGVSLVLPIAVFFVQCILFVKGVYYDDWSLIVGALVVNSGVLFSLYSIFKSRKA